MNGQIVETNKTNVLNPVIAVVKTAETKWHISIKLNKIKLSCNSLPTTRRAALTSTALPRLIAALPTSQNTSEQNLLVKPNLWLVAPVSARKCGVKFARPISEKKASSMKQTSDCCLKSVVPTSTTYSGFPVLQKSSPCSTLAPTASWMRMNKFWSFRLSVRKCLCSQTSAARFTSTLCIKIWCAKWDFWNQKFAKTRMNCENASSTSRWQNTTRSAKTRWRTFTNSGMRISESSETPALRKCTPCSTTMRTKWSS